MNGMRLNRECLDLRHAASLALILPGPLLAAQESPAPRSPWWDHLPRIIQSGDVEKAGKLNASVVMCGAADDPTWGLFGQRLRIAGSRGLVENIHASGMKAISWFEAFGTAGSCYVAQLKRENDGWVKYDKAPSLTRVFMNHWAWQLYDGTGHIRWVGVHNYFDDEEFARPYTRTHPRYGSPPMTYPDGTPAAGYDGPPEDPRSSRIYDAGCAKNVFGEVTFSYNYNAGVNEIDPQTGLLRGPTSGLLKVGEKYTGNVSPGKDAACPAWIDYARASVRQALDAGIDGLWCDNFSAWDDFHSRPLLRAFGEWSVATFRAYLTERFSPAQLEAMGIADIRTFDVRTYLRHKCREWGGRPNDLREGLLADPFDGMQVSPGDRAWRDPRWLDDPIWRAYLIHKRRNGTKALGDYYRTIKQAAAAAGKPDFLVSGNDIPVMSLGWVRGDLDMVSTELAWGWGLASGRRGFMPPPRGSYVPLYKLAREHAKSRFVNVWMYVPKPQWHKPGIANVLYYQALANHALPMPHVGHPRTVGDGATVAAFFDFVRRIAPLLGTRRETNRIGLYYSSSSQIMSFTPGGFRDHNDQRHMFAHWGWGTALTWLHLPYRAVPEWKLTPETLAELSLLIVPNSLVFPQGDAAILERWVRDGGRLIVTAASGQRKGEEHNFARRENGLSLAPLTGAEAAESAKPRILRNPGAGRVLYLRDPIGLEFFREDARREGMLPDFRNALETVLDAPRPALSVQAESVPSTVGLVTYEDRAAGRVFVDLNNTDIDIVSDVVTPAPAVSFTLVLPTFLRDRELSARLISPEPIGEAAINRVAPDALRVRIPPLALYACLVIEEQGRGDARDDRESRATIRPVR